MLLTATGNAAFVLPSTPRAFTRARRRRQPRLMLQIQYSLLPSYAYHYAPEPYQGPLVLDPYVNRLIVHRQA
jgi:hypothetical protein